jgi:hypothetical protein
VTGLRDDSGGKAPPDQHLAIGKDGDVRALYGHLYFAPLAAIASFSAAELVDAVLRADTPLPGTSLGPSPDKDGSFCAAQFVVSADPPHRFDPDLSMREPLELQVWPDGSFVVEIEFVGQDVRTDPEAGESVQAVLDQWAGARGWPLLRVFNDRGRSLPEVWNASFLMLDTSRPVDDAVAFARRAIVVAEAHRHGGRFVDRLLELLRRGDADGLIGTPVTSVFQPRPPRSDSGDDFRLALDVCAFANSVQGGLVVLGLEEGDGRVTAVLPATGDGTARIEHSLARLVFPAVEGVEVEVVGGGLVLVLVPPQEQVLKPFLVSGTVVDGHLHQQGVTLVERREATIYIQGVAALHSQIAAGRALLGGRLATRPGAEDPGAGSAVFEP